VTDSTSAAAAADDDDEDDDDDDDVQSVPNAGNIEQTKQNPNVPNRRPFLLYIQLTAGPDEAPVDSRVSLTALPSPAVSIHHRRLSRPRANY